MKREGTKGRRKKIVKIKKRKEKIRWQNYFLA